MFHLPITIISARPILVAQTILKMHCPLHQKTSFHKRPLPNILIAFSSPEGKQIFKESLNEGNLENFFPLIEQFHSQTDPAYCGLGSLSMVLNTLNIDPNRVWKGIWRWFDDEMLSCCKPLDEVKKEGITMREFLCLATCNGAKAKLYHADQCSIEHFRQTIIDSSTAKQPTYVVVSYSRKGLQQTGDGHYSPIGGYNKKRDMVLVLDVARFKYPPYWVKVETLWNAMLPIDKATNRSRGYIVMSGDGLDYWTSIFCSNNNTPEWKAMVCDVRKATSILVSNVEWKAENVESLVKQFVSRVEKTISDIPVPQVSCNSCAMQHRGKFENLYKEAMQTKMFKLVTKCETNPSAATQVKEVVITVLLLTLDVEYFPKLSPELAKKLSELQVLDENAKHLSKEIGNLKSFLKEYGIEIKCCK